MRLLCAFFALAAVGCAGFGEAMGEAGSGAAAGAASFAHDIPAALSATETGGIAAGATVLVLAAIKGIMKGLEVSNRKAVENAGKRNKN